MHDIRLLLMIIPRELESGYLDFLKREGMSAIFSALCEGTAGQSLLSMLGLEKTDKLMLATMASRRVARALMKHMVSDMGINMHGYGVALVLPVGSFGGASGMKYLLDNQDVLIGEGAEMSEKPVYAYDLIVAVAERGSSDAVMTAARTAGARGGTIVHAKGTGTEFTKQFFGVSIAAEKDVVLIVTRRETKDAIMRAVMRDAGIRTPAHAALFSLPVEDVAGLTSVMIEEDAES